MPPNAFDFAVMTIFAREFLEGSIIIGGYRTIISRTNSLAPGVSEDDALFAIFTSALVAVALALLVIACIAIPLALLSRNFQPSVAFIIEGVFKIVASISLCQLSLRVPEWLAVYKPPKQRNTQVESLPGKLTLYSIQMNVALNLLRETGECGVFLIPFFLSGENFEAIPLSAVIGSALGYALGLLVYEANNRLPDKKSVACFSVTILVFLSAGLFSGGLHNIENELRPTRTVWDLDGTFWSVDRLPMSVLKPFGYNDSRTVLEVASFWLALLLAGVVHCWKYGTALPVEEGRLSDPVQATEVKFIPYGLPAIPLQGCGDDREVKEGRAATLESAVADESQSEL